MDAAGRLNSWKEIAAHLGVSPRTAQRWERTEGLPARRHQHEVLSSVFAYRSELEAWWNGRPGLKKIPQDGRPTARSIAVLPFVNLNRDEETEILSDGITEELISALSNVQGLEVVARTSVFHFKGKTDDIRTIGSKLAVQTLLEGSLLRSGDRLRVTAQLTNAADGYHLWSRRFDHRLTDIFDLQDEIAGAIVRALHLKLQESKIHSRNPDGELYDVYLEGRYHCNRRTAAGFFRAVECFDRILASNPRMARAWAGLADCHAFLAPLAGVPFAEAMPRAKAAAMQALEIDPSLADAHCALGFVLAVSDYDWTGAEAHFRQALELQPEHAASHLWYGGHVLAALGRLAEAAEHATRACELDPLSPPARAGLGGSWLMSRHPDQAIAACRQALDLDPGYPIANRFLGEAWLLKGRVREAAEAFSRIQAPVVAAGFLGYCHARNGHSDEARRILADLERISSPSPALQAAAVSLGLGEHDAAFAWLQRASADRSMGVHWLKIEPIWDPLRADPRFPALLREMNLR